MNLINPNALITADDWGMSPGINEGILKLAQQRIIRRVSCMANGRFISHGLSELKEIPGIEIGLHFDLTYGKSLKQKLSLVFNSFFSLEKVRAFVLQEFRSQWSTLISHGLTPSYLDGHHHIHLLPGVLNPLLSEAKFAGVKTFRTVKEWTLLFSLKFPIVVLSFLATPKIKKHGFSTLPCWYPNLERIGLTRFKNKVAALPQKTEIIVHPAEVIDFSLHGVEDSYTDGRLDEFRILERLPST